MERRRLFLLCGIPGSGKSTWIKRNANLFDICFTCISRDAIRFSLLSNEDDYFGKEKEVWSRYVRQAKNALATYNDVILDATHLNPASRGKILRALGKSLKDVSINAIYIKVSLDTALKRNSRRKGLELVPEEAIRNMASNFSMPTTEEGFDNVYIYNNEEDIE